jgi:hypothetical protein
VSWTAGSSGNLRAAEILHDQAPLYLRFGRNSIDAVVMSFHHHRDRLRACCQQGGPSIGD